MMDRRRDRSFLHELIQASIVIIELQEITEKCKFLLNYANIWWTLLSRKESWLFVSIISVFSDGDASNGLHKHDSSDNVRNGYSIS